MKGLLAAALLALASPLAAQQHCTEPELQHAVTVWSALLEERPVMVMVGGTPDDYSVVVEERLWKELDFDERRSLLIAADVYAQCVFWPKVMRPSNPDTWICGIKAHTSISAIAWQSPDPIAEIRPDGLGGCEFRQF
ncbi:hypothetical protein [Candidatus Palauibacter sp.]|uniref:hypothetical protein n=1 Tax=Candidatus Palauibacter sp. TaxID=3101350 RepID=UPI003B51F801